MNHHDRNTIARMKAANERERASMVYRRMNLTVESMAGLEGGGVSVAGTINIDGQDREATVVLDREGWAKVCKNADWFRKIRPVGPPLSAHGIDIIEATTDEVVTAICVMVRKAAEAHRDPSDPYPTSGTYAAAAFAEELADDIANGEWRKHLRSTHAIPNDSGGTE